MHIYEFQGFFSMVNFLKSLILSDYVGVLITFNTKNKKKIRGLSPQANYTDLATADCRRS
jgi:hypothetical protein